MCSTNGNSKSHRVTSSGVCVFEDYSCNAQNDLVLGDSGAIKAIYTTSSPLADFDSVNTPGRYLFANDNAFNNAANVPMSGLQSPAYLDVVVTSGAQYQRLHCLLRDGNVYNELVFERKINNPVTPWSRLDNFGCNTPADLASLLGVVPSLKVGESRNYSQCQTIESGLFFVSDIVGAFSESETGYSGMILALQYNESSCLQLAFRLPTPEYSITGAAFRIFWATSWSRWYKISYT